MPIEFVPHIQKTIIRKCNEMSKPVITATQMLDSMIRNPLPTRAEASDIANAILDGTDAVMLSGETASGKYPILAVETMDKIAAETEKTFICCRKEPYNGVHSVVNSISLSTCRIAEELDAKAILVLTDSGRTARLVSRYKPNMPIFAITYNEDTVHRLMLSWGVFPLMVESTEETDRMLDNANNAALASGIVKDGDLVVTTAGIPAMVKGSTNMIKVEVLGHVFFRGTGVGRKDSITGKSCICANAEEAIDKLEPDDILITSRIDDSFIPVANRIRGIVTEEGAAGSYGEYFCEKFNIPGIMGVPNITTAFFSGRIITLDSDRGIVSGAKT
jgi:pyruvate kinase